MKRSQKLTSKQKQSLRSFLRTPQRSGHETRRAQAVLLIDKTSETDLIEEITHLKRSHIFLLRHNYLQKGLAAFLDRRKGKPKELLTKKQRQAIIKIIKGKRPKDLDAHYAKYETWSTGVLGDWIAKEYHVNYKSKTSYYLIFRQAQFTYHKPGTVYELHDEATVTAWRAEMTPKIKAALAQPDTIILCEDEMHLSTQTTVQKIWLPQGDYPKIEVSKTKTGRSIYGFLNIKTGQEQAWKTDWQNMFITVKILKKLRKIYPTQKLLILWDGAGWHRGSEVKKYLAKDQNMETIHFPRYSPELNPQEHVWKSGRNRVTHNHFIKDIDKTTSQFIKYLNSTKFAYSLLNLSPTS